MLVLSRKVGESIQIDDAIQLTVLSISNNQVRLGVTAPRSIPVHRSELIGSGQYPAGAAPQNDAVHDSRPLRK